MADKLYLLSVHRLHFAVAWLNSAALLWLLFGSTLPSQGAFPQVRVPTEQTAHTTNMVAIRSQLIKKWLPFLLKCLALT